MVLGPRGAACSSLPVSRQRVRECAAAHTVVGGGGSRDAAPNKEAPSASPPCETYSSPPLHAAPRRPATQRSCGLTSALCTLSRRSKHHHTTPTQLQYEDIKDTLPPPHRIYRVKVILYRVLCRIPHWTLSFQPMYFFLLRVFHTILVFLCFILSLSHM